MGYWKTRQEAMYKAGEMQVNQYYAKLEKAFNQTRRELQKTIESFYFEYAEENGLSYTSESIIRLSITCLLKRESPDTRHWRPRLTLCSVSCMRLTTRLRQSRP